MSEERILIIKSSKLTSGTTNNYYYDISGIIPLNAKNIKLQCLKSLIPNGGVSYNANYIQVLIDFGCGNSNKFPQVQNNLLLMDIINVNQYYQAYDNFGALHTFLAKNSEENNTKNNLRHSL